MKLVAKTAVSSGLKLEQLLVESMEFWMAAELAAEMGNWLVE